MPRAGEGPRASVRLHGHEAAEALLRQAWDSGRLAHAWLLHGPRGLGKATLAYRFARFVLAQGEPGEEALDPSLGPLGVRPESRLFRRVAAEAHAGLFVIEPGVDEKSGLAKGEISVERVRALTPFLRLTPGEGAWRVVIVDPADALGRSAANALLKFLEEPPARTLFLLVAEQAGTLLPTIRSRCQRLALRPLAGERLEAFLAARAPEVEEAERRVAAALAEGSPGRALELAQEGGGETMARLMALLAALPRIQTLALHDFAHGVSSSRGRDSRFRQAAELLQWWLQRLVRRAALGAPEGSGGGLEFLPGEAALARRLLAAASLDQWLAVWEKVTALLADTERYNLDRPQAVIAALTEIERAARGARPA